MTPESEFFLKGNRNRVLHAWNAGVLFFKWHAHNTEINKVITSFGLKTPFQTAKGE